MSIEHEPRRAPRDADVPATARRGRSPPTVSQPSCGPVGWLRWAWRQLTSMRTALFLLLLLSVAAVPGSIFPQRTIDAGRVADYLSAHPTTRARGSTGSASSTSTPRPGSRRSTCCSSCRSSAASSRARRLHWRALRSPPPRAPRRLERLRRARRDRRRRACRRGARAAARGAARRSASGSHVARRRDVSAPRAATCARPATWSSTSPCACVIVGVAVGHLFGWRGDVILPEGDTFAPALATYDSFSPGPWVDTDDLPPFAITLDQLDVTLRGARSAARSSAHRATSTAHVTTPRAPGRRRRSRRSAPTTRSRSTALDVFLLGNGYAPSITVEDAKGNVLYRQATPFLPRTTTTRSVGAVKVAGGLAEAARLQRLLPADRRADLRQRAAVALPRPNNPELALSVWEGTLFPGGARSRSTRSTPPS